MRKVCNKIFIAFLIGLFLYGGLILAVPTVSWDETNPSGSQAKSLGDDRIRELKTQLREVIAVDHEMASSGGTATTGQHKQVTLQEQADLGTGAVSATILGSQTVGGKGELVYTDEDDNDVQITSGGQFRAIVLAEMAANSVDSDQYVDGSIDLAHMSANSIDSTQYVDGSIDLAHMSINSIDSDQYVDGSIDAAHIATSAVTGAKILDDTVDSADYAAGSIDAEHLAADIVDETKIADNGIDSEHYNDGSIDAAHLAADIIDGTKIGDDVVDSEHYVAGSIDAEHLATDIIDETKLADNSIDSEHYNDGSIDKAHLASSSVSLDKFDTTEILNSSYEVSTFGTEHTQIIDIESGAAASNLGHDFYLVSVHATLSGDRTITNLKYQILQNQVANTSNKKQLEIKITLPTSGANATVYYKVLGIDAT